MQEAGLKVSDVVVLIDREQGGQAHLQQHRLKLHAAFTLSFIVDTLLGHKLLSAEVVQAVKRFIADNQTTGAVAGEASTPLSFSPPIFCVLFCYCGCIQRRDHREKPECACSLTTAHLCA
jgi:hypothetical protein